MRTPNRPAPHRPRVPALGLLLLASLLPVTAWAQRGGGSTPTYLDEDAQFEIVAEGDGWQLLQDTDVARRPVPDARLVAVWPRGVDAAPLPESIKDDLRADFELEGSDPGNLSEEPVDRNTDVIVVDQALAEAVASGASLEPWASYAEPDDRFAKLGCSTSWKTKTKHYDWSFDEFSGSQTFSLGGGLDGTLGFDVPFEGHANLEFSYEVKKTFSCIPYKFRFKQARFHGDVDILGSSDLTATFSLGGHWSDEWLVMNPKIGSTSFSIGPIPVYLEYRLPLYIGYDVAAELSGNVTLDTELGVSGTFDYVCTRDTCAGFTDFDDSFQTSSDQLTASVELDVEAEVNARLMFRVELYDDDFLYAEAGAKGFVEGDLWGYYGNQCGDGDADGENEFVQALVVDAAAGYDWIYGYGGIFGTRHWTWSGYRWSLGFWDLLGSGGSTALSAMIQGGSSEVPAGEPATYEIRLRPCYPYDEPIGFGMAPGDWDGELIQIKKGETKTVSRVFDTPNTYDLRVHLTQDTAGRPISTDQWRTIEVGEPPPPPGPEAALVLSYIPKGGGARREFRSETPGQQPTQEFLYNAVYGNFEERPGGACADGSANYSYVRIAYDGDPIEGCRFQSNADPADIECPDAIVAAFNSGAPFVINTDTKRIDSATCQEAVPEVTVCAPNQYCWLTVTFDYADGQQAERSLAYRKSF